MTRRILALLSTSVFSALPLAAQLKPTLKSRDYGRFENLGAARLSPDGRWIAYAVSRVDERAELRIRRLDREPVRAEAWGSQPAFSSNSRWLAWTVGVAVEERKRLEKDKKPVRSSAALLDLLNDSLRQFAGAASYGFDAGGRYLAVLGYPPEEPKGKGADLRLVDLASATELTIGNVSEYVWSGVGSLLAYTVATGTDLGNGVQVYDAASGRLRALDGTGSAYRQLAWRKKGADLAVYRSAEPAGKKGVRQVLLAWKAVDGPAPVRFELAASSLGIPDTLEVVEHRRPEWSEDGRRIAFGLRPVSPKADSARKPASDSTSATKPSEEELPGMQIWHSTDVSIFPQQKARATANARRTLLAVWEPDRKRIVPVGSDLMEEATLLQGWTHGVERRGRPYPWGTMFGRPYHDVWVTDLATGQRTQALEKVRYSWPSPGGRYLLWFDGKYFWSKDLRSGNRTNLTAGIPASFADTAYDTPTDLLPPFSGGAGGWLEGDQAVLLYDKYDVWRVAPAGGARLRLTDGAREQIIHRVVQPVEDRRTLDPAAPLYLSLQGEWSEKRGYARIERGGRPETLVFLDQLVSGLAKADSAPVLIYRAGARDDSPDYFVAGPELRAARQVSATNPFMAEYAWGKTGLIEYTSETGRRLQGVLLYPANHDPSRRYPMIVNPYEILSPQAHAFRAPSERDYYSPTAWTQEGYFVLLPDIVFRARDPGISVLEALRPAVARVGAMGLIDPKRVGLIGHSWGGYIATFVPTRTDLFAAAVAGAPLTDFVSFMGQIHWTPGNPEVDHWETGQARMEVPYWEDPEAHYRNSPIHKVHEMKTPLLMAFGDADGVVDWDQGTEFYNFARRAGKQMVLLVYEGENHGFVKKPNQIDYHRRILEWFGHYLKGEPPAAWITKGTSLDALDAEKRRIARTP